MKRPLPPTYFVAALVLLVVLHFVWPGVRIVSTPWRLLGFVPALAGAILNLVADGAFKRRNTTVKPFEEPSALVTTGVFRLTRNPMYVGMTLILAGAALLAGSATPWIPVVAFPFLMDRVFITPEEAMLEAKIGDEFRDHRASTRRWI